MKLLLVLLAMALVGSSALAQSRKLVDTWVDRWSEQNEIHVTKSARDNIFSSLQPLSKAEQQRIEEEMKAFEATNRAQSKQAPKEPAKVTKATKPPSARPSGVAGPGAPSVAVVGTVNSFLERFPAIHIVVWPTPPRDYSVSINGEDCPATEKSLYKVPRGMVEVRVERPGVPPCVWSGRVFSGQQEVACDLFVVPEGSKPPCSPLTKDLIPCK